MICLTLSITFSLSTPTLRNAFNKYSSYVLYAKRRPVALNRSAVVDEKK
jgi:hypothetical protein